MVATATVAALSLMVPIAGADAVVGGYHYKGKLWAADPLPAQPKVLGHPVTGSAKPGAAPEPKGSRALKTHTPAVPQWPAASTSTLTTGAGGHASAAPAGGAPVSVAAAAPAAAGNAAQQEAGAAVPAGTPAAVQAVTADHAGASAAGVDGLLVGLSRADGSAEPGKVSVSVDYSSIAQAYGGGWASRLHLVAMPACALTTPQLAECRTQQPLATTNDVVSNKLTATVSLPGSATAPAALPSGGASHRAVVPAALVSGAQAVPVATAAASSSTTAVAAVAGTSGSQGNYGATSLSASGSWAQSSSGAFTYGFPIQVPPSLGGAAPQVALSYNSQSVDGETSARNAQSSWIGDGWDYAPGFIERSYKSCANDGISNSADECWAGWNATLSLGAHTGQLVRDGSGIYHLQGDDGTKVEDLTGASNGLWNGEYFKVTTTDGTQYYLGLNHAPGTTSDPATNSAWGVPVYMPKSGDPCYSSSKGNASQCAAEPGWRFNLDFVVDPQGNVQRYDWNNEANWYNMGAGQANGSGGAMTAYTRGGYLTQISYGYQLADEQAGRDPAAKVVFSTAQRCTKDPTTCATLNTTTAPNWPDTPYDLNCTSGMATSGTGSNVCQIASPTFWSSYRLQTITTSVKVGTAWQNVDSYALSHLFSDAGGSVDPVTGKTVDPADAGALQSVMWLSQIQHTGLDTSAGGSGSITLDPVTFTGIETDNRVDGLTPAAPPLYHPRISSLQTETGESIAVTYRAPECSRVSNHMPASPDSDTMACFNVYWTTPGGVTPINDWFNKTLVAQVSDNDATKAGSPAKVTNYTYSGGAAWHRDDSDLTDDQYRTWNDFRGYRTVTTTAGAAPDPITQSVVNYFQGMDGDYKADGTQRSVSLADSLGEGSTDSNWLAGMPQEVDGYTQAGGTANTKVLTAVPGTTVVVSSARTAWTSKTPAPALSTLPDLTARRTQSGSERSLSLLANGSWRTTQVNTAYDSLGRPYQVDDKGDLAVPSQESCTTTSYANAPASNPMMLSYQSEAVTVSGACGTAASSTTTLNDKRVFYDGDGSVTNPGTLGQLGANGATLGMVTASQAVQSHDGSGNPVFQTLGAVSFDHYGRVVKSLDAAGSATTTSYAPATGTLPTAVSTVNPVGWTASSTLAAARGLTTHAVDVNGRVTDSSYDALGRRTASWLPGRNKATQTADKLFSYAVHGAGSTPDPSTVTTQTLREDGSYSTVVGIYDGFLQTRQTQSTTADNSAGRLISSTHYDSHGWVHSSTAPFVDTTTAPGTTLFVEQENTVPSETVATYDGQGRSTAATLYSKAAALWTSTAAYPGSDETDSTPPSGGTPVSVFTNALGETTSKVSHGGSGLGDVTTSYSYTPAGRLASAKDTAGNTWSYSYDLQGRITSQSDPDTGTSSTTYDALGRTASTTDARQQSLSYTYDQLSRKTGEYAGTSTADSTKLLSSYTYDTLAKGYPTSATRYVGGAAGSAYTQAVAGYNTAYQPTGTTITIPAAEGKLAGTYSMSAQYTPNTGLQSDSIYGTDGGLPYEDIGYGYNLQGGLVSTGSDSTPYLDLASYSPLGQVLQSTYGALGKQLRTAQTYDDATGRPATNRVSIQTASTNPISSTTLGYDQVGNLTTSSELQSSGGADQAFDTQCFQYDGLDRLATAWTDTAGQTTATAGQLSKCTSTSPTPATIGGPAPYWQTYSYNLLGDRTQQVKHDLTGNTANNTTQTLAYPTNGTQPHTVSGITTTGPAGSTTQTPTYDPAGNTTGRTTTGATATNQSFTYDAEGRTASVTTAAGVSYPQTTGYLYDAAGSLLIQRGPSSTTLYLFGGAEQLTLTGTTVSGLRYYTNPDGTVIVRSSSGTVTYQPTTTQGTAQLQVDARSLAITRRSFDPYGSPRGTAPAGWADNHGYLGRPTDTTTGLSLLGARQYDPALGRFLTADPLLELGDPNQMGGYTYAGNNPTTHSDPSGLLSDAVGDGGGGDPGGPVPTEEHFWISCVIHNAASTLDSLTNEPGKNDTDFAGSWDHWSEKNWGTDTEDVKIGSMGIDAATLLTPMGLEADTVKADGIVARLGKFIWRAATKDAVADTALDAAHAARVEKELAALDRTDPVTTTPDPKPTTDPAATQPGTGGGDTGSGDTGGGGGGGGPKTSSDGPKTGGGGGAEPTSSGTGKTTCSFSPDTPVLLGDGSTKPIGDIKVGDQVQTADPTTAAAKGAEPVTATGFKLDDNLVDLVVLAADGSRTTVHTTDNHPFYDATTHAWIPAGKLPIGDALATANGHPVQVAEVRITPGEANRYNLTVAQYHTYYVLAGMTPVLVHNCDGDPTPDDVVKRAQLLGDSDGEYLYRGITNNHFKLEEAKAGRAEPLGGHDDPYAHQGSDTESVFTSWSPDLETAREFSEEFGSSGALVLRIPYSSISQSRMTVAGQRGLEELEILIRDPVDGCEVSCEWGDFTQP
ncbi:polymorphic toxin-type HINT domain-containing protein [Kitasatospora sp. NPDC058965]|uniref:polymorphic toxin-type HINT domain-containing protein n=1 Tax=Kitasatospora sp. NPDC058965 TaxID=3346682 RepID=UPI0036C0EFDB